MPGLAFRRTDAPDLVPGRRCEILPFLLADPRITLANLGLPAAAELPARRADRLRARVPQAARRAAHARADLRRGLPADEPVALPAPGARPELRPGPARRPGGLRDRLPRGRGDPPPGGERARADHGRLALGGGGDRPGGGGRDVRRRAARRPADPVRPGRAEPHRAAAVPHPQQPRPDGPPALRAPRAGADPAPAAAARDRGPHRRRHPVRARGAGGDQPARPDPRPAWTWRRSTGTCGRWKGSSRSASATACASGTTPRGSCG